MSTAATDAPVPTHIYKLIPYTAPPPDILPDALPVSELDQTSGFVHLSTAPQVANTLKFFFGDHPHVFVARIPYAPVEKDIKWEDPKGEVCGPRAGEGMFPHLYNGLRLGKNEIDSVARWDRDESGWDAVLEKSKNWLIY